MHYKLRLYLNKNKLSLSGNLLYLGQNKHNIILFFMIFDLLTNMLPQNYNDIQHTFQNWFLAASEPLCVVWALLRWTQGRYGKFQKYRRI